MSIVSYLSNALSFYRPPFMMLSSLFYENMKYGVWTPVDADDVGIVDFRWVVK